MADMDYNKIGCSTFEVKNFPPGKSECVIQHFLNSNDDAIVIYLDDKGEEITILKFDSTCRVYNNKGTLVGNVRMSDKNAEGFHWDFFEINQVDGKIVSTLLLRTKEKYPFDAEPIIIKWLGDNNLLQHFVDK